MADPSYIYFNKSVLQCRSLGARGGRAFGRNQRARRALLPTPSRSAPGNHRHSHRLAGRSVYLGPRCGTAKEPEPAFPPAPVRLKKLPGRARLG